MARSQTTNIITMNEETEHKKRLAMLELHLGSEYYRTGEFHNNISNAMGEYADIKAKEVAIGYDEWKESEGWTKRYNSDDDNDGKWYNEHYEGINRHYRTSQQLYQLYLNHLQSIKQ